MTWTRLNRKRLPKTGSFIVGSWRRFDGGLEWTTSSMTDWDWIADDRTHYCRLPKPPKKP